MGQLFQALLLASSLLGITIGVVQVKTKSGQDCIAQYRITAGGELVKPCHAPDGVTPICATSVDANLLATTTEQCGSLNSCVKTLGPATCTTYTYKGIRYSAGTCIYEDSGRELPWCGYGPEPYEGYHGQVNWDYCGCQSGDSDAATTTTTATTSVACSTSYDYSNPNTKWCNNCGSKCCPNPASSGMQSPIDLCPNAATPVDAALTNKPIQFSDSYFCNLSGKIKNNGHTAQFDPDSTAKKVTITGGPMGTKTYVFAQLHFHWGSTDTQGSEHTLCGKKFPLEVHLVHYNEAYGTIGNALGHSDGLAVLGIFFEIGADNKLVEALKKTTIVNAKTEDTATIKLSDLLSAVPDLCNYVTYSGSLTTPGCAEVVTWINFMKPATVGSGQLQVFRTYKQASGAPLSDNFRPVQPINSRVLKSNVQQG